MGALSEEQARERLVLHAEQLREALVATEPEGGEGALEEGSPQDVLRSAAFRLLTTIDLMTAAEEQPPG
ncbi:hypothetical protein [Streptomyces sp. OK228]|uniref:hypothetical protein n=1 Tax=Streptomyces sp. OK228 TaxID=1882786 RepID=UPI000BCEAB73|nr:hypothetical protein [Streptomyces sp. OK228]SOE31823.1 hypothetical protein SAMN05442782_8757 [Streptomyces sp. OK228]